MKNILITLTSVAALAGAAQAQTWASTSNVSAQSGCISPPAVTGNPDLFNTARTTDHEFCNLNEYVTYDFGAAGISAALGKILVWETTGNASNTLEFNKIDVLLSNDGVAFTSIKASEADGFLTGTETAGVEVKDVKSYDVAFFGATARYLKIKSTHCGKGFDLNTVGVNALPVTVPEPSSTALLGLGALGLLARRKR